MFIDILFSCHTDDKRHSALVATIGDTHVIAVSRKQNITTRNSMEAEFVIMSDMVLISKWLHDFIRKQGMKIDKPVII